MNLNSTENQISPQDLNQQSQLENQIVYKEIPQIVSSFQSTQNPQNEQIPAQESAFLHSKQLQNSSDIQNHVDNEFSYQSNVNWQINEQHSLNQTELKANQSSQINKKQEDGNCLQARNKLNLQLEDFYQDYNNLYSQQKQKHQEKQHEDSSQIKQKYQDEHNSKYKSIERQHDKEQKSEKQKKQKKSDKHDKHYREDRHKKSTQDDFQDKHQSKREKSEKKESREPHSKRKSSTSKKSKKSHKEEKHKRKDYKTSKSKDYKRSRSKSYKKRERSVEKSFKNSKYKKSVEKHVKKEKNSRKPSLKLEENKNSLQKNQNNGYNFNNYTNYIQTAYMNQNQLSQTMNMDQINNLYSNSSQQSKDNYNTLSQQYQAMGLNYFDQNMNYSNELLTVQQQRQLNYMNNYENNYGDKQYQMISKTQNEKSNESTKNEGMSMNYQNQSIGYMGRQGINNDNSFKYSQIGQKQMNSNMGFESKQSRINQLQYQNQQKQLGNFSLQQYDWGTIKLKSFIRQFLPLEHSGNNQKMMEQEQKAQEYRMAKQIIVKTPGNVPSPMTDFYTDMISRKVYSQFQRDNFREPTPIQAQAWPILLSGYDFIGIAQTGSGKTLSFLIPAMVHIKAQEKPNYRNGPICLIMAPTRELAMQIQKECQKYGQIDGLKSECIYGGAPKDVQRQKLMSAPDILVATPGRLIDFLQIGMITLLNVTFLILDEADRMLDMGFEPQIRKIISQVRPDRQTCMFSATWPKEVKQLALDFTISPKHIQIGLEADNNENITINKNIEQIFFFMTEQQKYERISRMLREYSSPYSKCLIFCSMKKRCEMLQRTIKMEGYNSICIHGNKNQMQRDEAIRHFKEGREMILIATDIASRGLNILDIKVVINFDFPNTIEDYVHRIGRTGRAGLKGKSITFFTEENMKQARSLINLLDQAKQPVPQELRNYAEKQRYRQK